MAEPLSLYIHIPFCKSRCSYCDFNTFTGLESEITAYGNALQAEIAHIASHLKIEKKVRTIYFGGGTPSLLPATAIKQILSAIAHHFMIMPDAEITLEANPGDITAEKSKIWADNGINRISLGMQSANEEELRRMARRHTFAQVQDAISILHIANLTNISLDLIYGYPLQTLQSWADSLTAACQLNPTHLSLYALTVEENTQLTRQITSHSLPVPDDDLTADMADLAVSFLAKEEFHHYEISNWSQPGLESQHNQQYWKLEPYLGFGAGAHGYCKKIRTQNEPNVHNYIQAIQTNRCTGILFPAAIETEAQSLEIEMSNYLIFGLRRLSAGVSPTQFEQRFGMSIDCAFPKIVQRLRQKGWLLQNQEGNLILAPQMVFLSNQIFREFLSV